MAIVQGWLPPTRENWELACFVFQLFPLITIFQWIQPWYGMGKTSVVSRFNMPGKTGWLTMEAIGPITFLYLMFTLPAEQKLWSLPFENKLMAGLYCIHYTYRAFLYPLLAPSISPIHFLPWITAVFFNLTNALSLGGYLFGHGPTTRADWITHSTNYVDGARMEAGFMLWAVGFAFMLFHDDELREIRRAAARKQKKEAAEQEQQDPSTGKQKGMQRGVDKHYVLPQNGVFKWVLFPHYLFEWVEWTGFAIMGGWRFTPGRTFVFNEVATMLPRALQGMRWYVEKFGREKVGGRWAVLPGIA